MTYKFEFLDSTFNWDSSLSANDYFLSCIPLPALILISGITSIFMFQIYILLRFRDFEWLTDKCGFLDRVLICCGIRLGADLSLQDEGEVENERKRKKKRGRIKRLIISFYVVLLVAFLADNGFYYGYLEVTTGLKVAGESFFALEGYIAELKQASYDTATACNQLSSSMKSNSCLSAKSLQMIQPFFSNLVSYVYRMQMNTGDIGSTIDKLTTTFEKYVSSLENQVVFEPYDYIVV